MEFLSAWLGRRIVLGSGRPVRGLVALWANHSRISSRSYVCPSAVTTGSRRMLRVRGQRNESGASSSGASSWSL
eukprot:755558-Hanusia_phi.AAC.1